MYDAHKGIKHRPSNGPHLKANVREPRKGGAVRPEDLRVLVESLACVVRLLTRHRGPVIKTWKRKCK